MKVKVYDLIFMEREVDLPEKCPGRVTIKCACVRVLGGTECANAECRYCGGTGQESVQCGADLRAVEGSLREHALSEQGYSASVREDRIHYDSTTGDGGDFFTVRIACAECDHVFGEGEDDHVESPRLATLIKRVARGRGPERRAT